MANIITGWKRFVVASDVHGDMQDAASNRVLFKFLNDFNPDIRVFAGDLWDFRCLRKGASEEERRESMRKDYDAGIVWLHKFKPHHFLRGNHDQRLWETAESDRGGLSDYAMLGVIEIEKLMRDTRCKMYPYDKRDGVMKLGSLKILHGFHCGVYAGRQTALIYGSSLFGHTHVISQDAIAGLERRVARNIGCLCQLEMDYNSRNPNTLRQANGFAYGTYNPKSGVFHVWQAESINGKWVLPSDIIEYS